MIKLNMDMPNNCFECKFSIPMWNLYKCALTEKISDDEKKRKPEFCPFRKENKDIPLSGKDVYEVVRDVVLRY